MIHSKNLLGHSVLTSKFNIYPASEFAVTALTEAPTQDLNALEQKSKLHEFAFRADKWVGKVAVVTGAASGIGAAIVNQLVQNGLIVVGIDLHPEPIEERAKILSGKKGPVHILANNAGYSKFGSLMDDDTETWKTVLDTNVLGLCMASREAIKIMRANNINGHIVHINSIFGHIVTTSKFNVYPASKFAVTALAETLRQELKMVLSMDRWVGKTAVVTGAASGMGEAIAKQLVQTGVIVAGIDLHPEPMEENSKILANEKGKLHAFKADITKEEELLAVFKNIETNLGPIHILVNNAGTCKFGTIIDGNTPHWETVFKVNVFGLCMAAREAIKSMRAHNVDGHIININSMAGHKIITNVSVYPASKFSVTAITETLRQEVEALGIKIKITSLSPGSTKTGLTVFSKDIKPEVKAALMAKPFLNAEDIADGVVYALSTPPHVQIRELTITPFNDVM
ncbi:adh short and/or KR domain containing protein [Asbolus verrucosus]|uniref:Adh short and/or KR domain containing protein n=1 Tax=Asbolus verrucosus TaxID=1661398 RepID=A0A482VK03_ASBVE|nr:adh short and/or KR domain containing protein [Asbolus verrucosus]